MKMSASALNSRGFDVVPAVSKKEESNNSGEKEQTVREIIRETVKEIHHIPVENKEEREQQSPIIVPIEGPVFDRIEKILLNLAKIISEQKTQQRSNPPQVQSLPQQNKSTKKPSGMTMDVKRDKYGFIENATFDFTYNEDK